jgi:hypothetical protein
MSFDLVDKAGGEIRATAWNDQVDQFQDMIQVGGSRHCTDSCTVCVVWFGLLLTGYGRSGSRGHVQEPVVGFV